MDNAGAFAGPIVAAILLKFFVARERTVFLLALVPGLAAAALLLFRVPDRAPSAPVADRPDAAPAGSLPRSFWIATSIFAVFALANSTDAFLLLRARDAGVPLWQTPLLWALFQGVRR
jgi:MFS family permease